MNPHVIALMAGCCILAMSCHSTDKHQQAASFIRPRASETLFLAGPGPTKGSQQILGKPWLASDSSGMALLAFMVPVQGKQELRVRLFDSGQGWGPEEKVMEGLADTPWISAQWATGKGPILAWCDRGDPMLGHCHPFLLRTRRGWRKSSGVSAPEGTYSVEHGFPRGALEYIDHYIQDPSDQSIKRLIREVPGSGTEAHELFRFATVPGGGDFVTWHRGDGTQWSAAVVPAPGKGGADVVVQRRRVDGSRSGLFTLGRVKSGTCSLTSAGSEEGWAVVAWTSGTDKETRLHIRQRTPDRWLPSIDLGLMDRNDPYLDNDLWIAGPDGQGRMALAWTRGMVLLSTHFDPVTGWTTPETHGTGVELASWGQNTDGERVLIWGQASGGTLFHARRWSWNEGWGKASAVPMPKGALPDPVLFDDGSGFVVGLASDHSDMVRPWTMLLP